MRLTYLLCLPLVAAGCGDFGGTADQAAEDSFQDDDIPMGGCNSNPEDCPQSTAGPGASVGESCDNASQCESGTCAAPFDGGAAGELVCQSACIDYLDDTKWCSDSASCCDPNATCTARGFCLMSDEPSESSESGSEGFGGSSDSEGGSSDSDGGSSSGGASESGSESGTTGEPTGTTGDPGTTGEPGTTGAT